MLDIRLYAGGGAPGPIKTRVPRLDPQCVVSVVPRITQLLKYQLLGVVPYRKTDNVESCRLRTSERDDKYKQYNEYEDQ